MKWIVSFHFICQRSNQMTTLNIIKFFNYFFVLILSEFFISKIQKTNLNVNYTL